MSSEVLLVLDQGFGEVDRSSFFYEQAKLESRVPLILGSYLLFAILFFETQVRSLLIWIRIPSVRVVKDREYGFFIMWSFGRDTSSRVCELSRCVSYARFASIIFPDTCFWIVCKFKQLSLARFSYTCVRNFWFWPPIMLVFIDGKENYNRKIQ